jgi:hypothetical protein
VAFPRPQIKALFPLIVLPLFLSCESTGGQPQEPAITVYDHPGLLQISPADVVIPPVQDLSEWGMAPATDLRNAFQQGLVSRRYSPLALDYVDAHLAEAGFVAGSLREEAILQIQVWDWDMSIWDQHSIITVDVEARLLNSNNPDGEALWGARFARRINLSRERHQSPTRALVQRRAAQHVASEILANLPARNPVPGGN